MNKQKVIKETETKPELHAVLFDVILQVLKTWENEKSGDFDAMLYCYETLLDEIREKGIKTTIKELKKAMKKLRNQGVVELKPIYDDEWKICGSGYFLCQNTKN